jgi:hypothetical protein
MKPIIEAAHFFGAKKDVCCEYGLSPLRSVSVAHKF